MACKSTSQNDVKVIIYARGILLPVEVKSAKSFEKGK